MYEPPIEIMVKDVCQDIGKKTDDAIMLEITRQFDVNVNKEELIKALKYDRGQYEKGFADGSKPLWFPVTVGMPSEHDTMFAKYYGTERWNKYMFRKRSDKVEVTVELDDGTRYTDASRTHDGKWDIEEKHGFVHKKVVAWKPMSEPWRG